MCLIPLPMRQVLVHSSFYLCCLRYRIVFYTELPLVFEAFLKASKRGVLHVIKGFKTSYTFLQERSSFLLQHVSHLCMYVYRNVCSKFLCGSRGHSGGATQGIQGPLINNTKIVLTYFEKKLF
jgi:hypothetical protein